MVPKNNIAISPYSKETFKAIWEIQKIVLETTDFNLATQKVVNVILDQLGYLQYGYHVIVLSLLDEEKDELRRIAISKTESANKFLNASPVPFKDIKIPLNSIGNISVKAIRERSIQSTSKVSDILVPALPQAWVDKFQDYLKIQSSIVFPIQARDKIIGVLIFSLTKKREEISKEEWTILETFVGAVGIALDNALLFKSLNETTSKLAKANDRLKELDKLKDDFVSVASHELRTPMTAIKSYLWMAITQKKEELTPDLAKYLDRAYISVERLINLVNDMLNISRIEGGRIALSLEEVNPMELAKDIAEEVHVKAGEKNLQVIVSDSQIPTVLCDKDKIHEVYLNLVGNALKFSKKGEQITIDHKVEGDFVKISVTDRGAGISKENISHLFKKFGRLESSYVAVAESGGTGLGLYICKSLVEIHKGQIGATSPGPGKGSTFYFTLPIANSKTAQLLKKEAPKETDGTKDLEKTRVSV